MNKPSVLVVEDETTILDALVYNLQKENFDVYLMGIESKNQ